MHRETVQLGLAIAYTQFGKKNPIWGPKKSNLSTLFRALVGPLLEGVFGRNLGVSKSIWWTSNLQFLGWNQSRLARFQLAHFSYPVGKICWNLAEYPCLGQCLTHFPMEFLDEIWGFRSPYDGLQIFDFWVGINCVCLVFNSRTFPTQWVQIC